ncbi:hypothetical protein REPUB_Repub02eG0209100 [Reevesia pubescens]
MDVVHCISEDDVHTWRYYLLPCFFLFDRSNKLLKLVLNVIGLLLTNSSLSLASIKYANDSLSRINATVSLLLLMYKDVKVRKIISLFRSEIGSILQSIASLQSSEVKMTLEERHRFQCSFEQLKFWGRDPEEGQLKTENGPLLLLHDKFEKPISEDGFSRGKCGSNGRNLNKKRSYAQFHLEFGQSDFLLHGCSTCGVKYSPGDEVDEKNHSIFHKNFTLGIHFKGWRNKRVVHVQKVEGGRIILVFDSDPVQEVVKMMEIELGGGWIFHKLCKVFLFVSSQRIAGCLVAEPIKESFKVLSCSVGERHGGALSKQTRLNSSKL